MPKRPSYLDNPEYQKAAQDYEQKFGTQYNYNRSPYDLRDNPYGKSREKQLNDIERTAWDEGRYSRTEYGCGWSTSYHYTAKEQATIDQLEAELEEIYNANKAMEALVDGIKRHESILRKAKKDIPNYQDYSDEELETYYDLSKQAAAVRRSINETNRELAYTIKRANESIQADTAKLEELEAQIAKLTNRAAVKESYKQKGLTPSKKLVEHVLKK